MRKISILIISALFVIGCKPKPAVHSTFYYWKTDYQNRKAETNYLELFKSKSLYVRIMDVDFDPDLQQAVPVSPISFSNPLPAKVDIVPVVYIVNQVFNNLDSQKNGEMANRIAKFVDAKVKQAGKQNYTELQIDCDWTKTTKAQYFNFLNLLQKNPLLKGKTISVTLRLHQVKNLVSSGIPPVKKVMLMCYNMGNLRKYGTQNSILDMHEMDVYLKKDIGSYPLKMDVALPIFEWAVVFRKQQYAGISKRINKTVLHDKKLFKQKGESNLYTLLLDYPTAGLKMGDEVRWEEITLDNLLASSKFLSRYLPSDERNLVFYHLDIDLLKHFTNEDFQKIIADF
ncbi:hypothetical protein [Pedobacter nototheniae]|uniref:hypothetical protein n=1 Tax=Pedobacter nototheniae TaxID=2488994 RepID=UPI00103FD597|nr:hypothetical protein [Pedobacter nototheniae]